ncbi:hypothetical protein [Cryobacterium sp. Y11]|nr:hypothetical protein [Cryobacterium sp. Y11]
MEQKTYGRFTPQLRADAVRRVAESEQSIVKVAVEIGIDHRTWWW